MLEISVCKEATMIIPNKLKAKLELDPELNGLVLDFISYFKPILENNCLFFFEEYTDHGIKHVKKILETAERLIPDKSFQDISSKEAAILILAVVLHDIGMHINYSTFKAMIDGKYDNIRVEILDKKTWPALWRDYLLEAKYFNSKQLEDIFGNPNEIINEPDLSDKDKLNGKDRKLIGEFIRRNHERLAHEIALNGFDTIPFENKNLSEQDRKFAGIIARSHKMDINDTFEYLKSLDLGEAWKNPEGIYIIYLMVLLRIADALQINKTRTNRTLSKIKNINSYVSFKEHEKHLIVSNVNYEMDDPELIYVECTKPENPQLCAEIQKTIEDIQKELDSSWKILKEVYMSYEKPKIKFKKIESNLGDEYSSRTINDVPKKNVSEERNELSIAPLYGDNLTTDFTDQRDGKIYRTVKIGNQIWMAENLAYNEKRSKCYDNNPDNCKKYGRLYDLETAISACPKGWHLPSDAEWGALIAFFGGNNAAGTKLKAKTGWSNNGNGTDESGFSALPGGCYSSGCFDDAGNYGYWWSSDNNAHVWCIFYDNEAAGRADSVKSILYSVRCVKDTP